MNVIKEKGNTVNRYLGELSVPKCWVKEDDTRIIDMSTYIGKKISQL